MTFRGSGGRTSNDMFLSSIYSVPKNISVHINIITVTWKLHHYNTYKASIINGTIKKLLTMIKLIIVKNMGLYLMLATHIN